ncbi:MAG: arylesterase [Chthoniobacterales bacterium]|nr:arylesterase [Chthoniobacterales bacterium]
MQWLIPLLILGLSVTSTLAKPATVLVLGDSLSAGYGLKRSAAYPALLLKKANAAGVALTVVNASVSGDTTAGGLQRLPALLHQHMDVLVLELGINDAFRGVPVAQIATNLQAIIDLTKKRYPKVRIVIAGMQLPEASGEDYLAAFGRLYLDLAKRNDAALIPFLLRGVAGDPSLNQNDLLHPNADGQKILAATVWPFVRSAVTQASSLSSRAGF